MPDQIVGDWWFWYGVIGVIIAAHFMETMKHKPNRWHYIGGVIMWPLLVFLWIEVYCKEADSEG
jgi:hypothetical protein